MSKESSHELGHIRDGISLKNGRSWVIYRQPVLIIIIIIIIDFIVSLFHAVSTLQKHVKKAKKMSRQELHKRVAETFCFRKWSSER